MTPEFDEEGGGGLGREIGGRPLGLGCSRGPKGILLGAPVGFGTSTGLAIGFAPGSPAASASSSPLGIAGAVSVSYTPPTLPTHLPV